MNDSGVKRKKTKRAVTYVVEDSDEEDYGTTQKSKTQTEFSSIAPVQLVKYTIKVTIDNDTERLTNISIKLSVEDVFAELHELSALSSGQENMVVNPTPMPSWLTGGEAPNGGIV